MIYGIEAMVYPWLLTVWFALQTELTKGFCFYLGTFDYPQYAEDSAMLIDMCSLKAY